MLYLTGTNKRLMIPITSGASKLLMLKSAKGLAVYDTTAGSFILVPAAPAN
ncbi:MAG: hypothetical protein WEA59_09565 [Ferruginibacter sp.]